MPDPDKNKTNDAVLNGYLDYWDETIEKWLTGKSSNPLHGCENDPFLPTVRRFVQPNLMPEPYWGDPANCSIVIANLNPGGGEDPDETTPKTRCEKAHRDAIKWFMGEVKTSGYWNVAKRAPVFLSADELSKLDATSDKSGWARFSCYNGWKWWYERGGRRQWAEHFCRDLAPEATRGLKPFAMELCGWHSAKWNRRASNAVKMRREPFDRFVLAPLFEAVRQSKTKLGICLGADWNNVFGSAKLPSARTRPSEAPERGRNYSAFDIGDNARILVTWKRSFRFSVPDPGNWPFETEFVRILRNAGKH